MHLQRKITMSIYTMAIIIAGGCSPLFAAEALTYKDIAELYLPTFGIEEDIPTKEETSLNFQELLSLSDIKKREITFSLFATTFDKTPQKASAFPINTLTHDLNILAYRSKQEELRSNSLLRHINGGTLTFAGEAILAHIVTHPTADIPTLHKRQALVQSCTKPELKTACETILQSIKTHEAALLSCFRDTSKIENETIQKLYFTKPWLTFLNNEYMLGFCSRFKDSMVTMPLIGRRILGAASIYYVEKYAHKMHPLSNPKPSFVEKLKQQLQLAYSTYNIFGYRNFYNKIYEECITTAPLAEASPEERIQFAKRFAIATVAVSPLVELYMWYMTKNLWDAAYEQYHSTIYLQEKLMGCAALIRAADQICLLAHKGHPELEQEYNAWAARRPAPSAPFTKLLAMLRTATFKGAPSYFSRVGRVQKAYKLLQETKDELIPYMELIGIVDAHQAIAQLYTNSLTSKVPYSFVRYIAQHKGPYFKATEFRNPMISSDVIVSNDIEFGGSTAPRGAIVTGSNSAGKSTIMVTGVTAMLLLAQTITIAPARELQLIPFDYIGTSLKVGDNVITGESHAIAERNHKNRLYADIQTVVQQGGFAFLAIDELFEGFTPEVGSKALYEFGKQLAEIPQLIFVISTQFQTDPTRLEQETNGICKNYCIDVERAANGTITRPYKIRSGVSTINIGSDLLSNNA